MADRPTRRSFLRVLAGETLCLVEELRGRPQMRLADLATVPDHVLGAMVPVLDQGLRIGKEGLERDGGEGELVPLKTDQSEVVALFDGQRTVQEVADEVAADHGYDDDGAFAVVRAAFLDLTRRGLSWPLGAHDHLRDPEPEP